MLAVVHKSGCESEDGNEDCSEYRQNPFVIQFMAFSTAFILTYLLFPEWVY